MLTFVVLRLAPGNPARLILGPFATQSQINQFVAQLGLKQPWPVQYERYISNFLHGDWGFSYSAGESVRQLFAQRFPATIELALYAFAFAIVTAVILALASTYRRRRASSVGVGLLSAFGLGTPPFLLGLLLLLGLSEGLGILPGPEGRLSVGTTPPPSVTGLYTVDALLAGQFTTFADAVRHLILPAITLGLAPMAFLLRLLRANLLDVSQENFMLVVESKGIDRWTAFVRHALPNAALPTLTAAGLIFGQLLAGSVLVEKVFNWPGVGDLVTNSILQQDYSVVQAFVLITAGTYIFANLLVDVLYGVVDPRVHSVAAYG